MPSLIFFVINSKLATLHELDTIYSYDDLLDLCEIACSASYNEFQAAKEANKKRR